MGNGQQTTYTKFFAPQLPLSSTSANNQ